MGQVSLTLPTAGSTPNSTADPEIVAALNTLASAINGGLDATNIAAALAQATGVNQIGQTVKGAINTTASQSVTSTTYALMPTADQVQAILLPTNGLIGVWYQAIWQESVAGAGRAAIFLGANQLQVQEFDTVTRQPQPTAAITASSTAAVSTPLFTVPGAGLASVNTTASYLGDVTTGQVMGFVHQGGTESTANVEVNGHGLTLASPGAYGGPCYVFAAAGTYTVSVQFKSSSGSVTASNRKLFVEALSFA